MYFTKEIKTVPLREDEELEDKVRSESTETHVIISIPFTHCNGENMEVKVSDEPFGVEISSYENISYYTMKVNLDLNKEIVSLQNVFYTFDNERLHVHIPHENLKLRKKPQKVLIPHENKQFAK